MFSVCDSELDDKVNAGAAGKPNPLTAAPLESMTFMGAELLAVLVRLLPSCPQSFSPQHFTAPDESNAQVCLSAVIAETPVNPETSTGVSLCVVVPSPSTPLVLSPQHFTAPDESNAQV